MRIIRSRSSILIVIAIAAITFATSMTAISQDVKQISATAMGTSTQLGRIVRIDLRISRFSTPADQSALLTAYGESGSEGLANALDKMSAKGRIAITGTLGFDINYIRQFKMPDGSVKYRFVTDRPIRFGEAWGSTRSMDYALCLGEIIIRKKKGKSSGTLIPAARLKLNSEKELEIEAYQNPWKLTNLKVWR